MSKGAQTMMAKAESLAEGMLRNLSKVQSLGFGNADIERLREGVKTLAATDSAVEEAAAALSELRRTNNDTMSRLNDDVVNIKKAIKRHYDKMEWPDFGIADKQ